jgi:hypothetical protein
MLRLSQILICAIALVIAGLLTTIFYFSGIGVSNQAVTPASKYVLSPEKILDYTARATNGDIDAVWHLVNYYGIHQADIETQYLWIKRASDLGDDKAQYMYAYKLFNDARLLKDAAAREKLIGEALSVLALIPNRDDRAVDELRRSINDFSLTHIVDKKS